MAIAILLSRGQDTRDASTRVKSIDALLGHTDTELKANVQVTETFSNLYLQAFIDEMEHIGSSVPFSCYHMLCRLFPERPPVDANNDEILGLDRKIYSARLQEWEYEEMASVPFLSSYWRVYAGPRCTIIHNAKSLASVRA